MENINPVVWSAVIGLCAVIATVVFFYKRRVSRFRKRIDELASHLRSHSLSRQELTHILVLLYEYSRKISSITDVDSLCQTAVDYSTQLVNSSRGSLFLLNHDTGLLEMKASCGINAELAQGGVKPGNGIVGRVAREGQGIICENIESDGRFIIENRPGYESASFISVPLKAGPKVIGVLNANDKSSGQKFAQNDLKALTILAGLTGPALEDMIFARRTRRSYLETVQTLARSIDAKDPYTRGHSDRVAHYAVAVAKKLDLSNEFIATLENAALMHDVGKIGIREGILGKPGRLSDEEYDAIKMHPLIGERIIGVVSSLRSLVPIVLYHHERFDGKGYLDGLARDTIPFGARILAVCDAYDAMTSERPYRPAMPKERAMGEIQRCRGTQFDPDIVDVFLEILQKEKFDTV